MAQALALTLIAAALVQAWTFPAWPLALTGLIAAAVLAVAWQPAWALVVLPAAMPVLDVAPLSGRLLWDEFDLMQLAVLAAVWWRTAGQARAAPVGLSLGFKLVLAMWLSSLVLSLAIGGMPWPWPDANSQLSQHQPYNALRIAKGALWAVMLILAMRRLPQPQSQQQRLFSAGLCLGLVLALAVLVWERMAFADVLDFAADYRVTGPFSAMHTGGATVECFIAMTSAVALAALLQARTLWLRTGLLLLLATASYGVAVTYSRGGYAAMAVGVLAVLLCGWAGRQRQHAQPVPHLTWVLTLLLSLLLMVAAATPVALGSFARQRLALSGQDLAVRQAHWRDALALRDTSLWGSLVGSGLGRYPDLHFWHSAEPSHAGVFSHRPKGAVEADSPARLRLGAGTQVYVEQLVDVRAGQRLTLSLDLRSPADAQLGIALCEKWLLTSAQCATVTPLPPAVTALPARQWQQQQWRLDTSAWTATALPRPVKLALFHAGGPGTVEVSQVSLVDDTGQPLLRNGDFADGFDHWFFSTDVDPPWHIHNWPVTVLLEQGWLGVVAWFALLAVAVAGALRRARQGDLAAAGIVGALLAFVCCAMLNTLTDTPRMLWLLVLLLWLGATADKAALHRSARVEE